MTSKSTISIPPEERSKLIRRKLKIKKYIQKLSILAGRDVNEEDIESNSLEKYLQEKEKISHKKVVYTIPFQDMKSKKFSDFIQKLHQKNNLQVYVWLNETRDCGLFLFKSILDINFNFDFYFNGGIIVITTADFRNELLLDFYENDDGDKTRILDIRISGEDWIDVEY